MGLILVRYWFKILSWRRWVVFVGILVKNDSGDDGNGKANQAKKEVPVDGNSCARKAGKKGSSLYFNCCQRCDMKIFQPWEDGENGKGDDEEGGGEEEAKEVEVDVDAGVVGQVLHATDQHVITNIVRLVLHL